jgi:hypothetical protein
MLLRDAIKVATCCRNSGYVMCLSCDMMDVAIRRVSSSWQWQVEHANFDLRAAREG